MILDAYLSLWSMSSATKVWLADPKSGAVGLITQLAGLGTIVFMVSNMIQIAEKARSTADCQCFAIDWYGKILTCSSISVSNYLYLGLRMVRWIRELWLSVTLSRWYQRALTAKNSQHEKIEFNNVEIAPTVYDSIPATAISTHIGTFCLFLGTIFQVQRALNSSNLTELKSMNTWSQSAQIFGVTWIFYRWVKSTISMCSKESVDRRQATLKRASVGTLVPDLSKRGKTPGRSAAIGRIYIDRLVQFCFNHPFSKYPPRTNVDHSRLQRADKAWEAMQLEFLQWPNQTADQKGQLLLEGGKQGDVNLVKDLIEEKAPVDFVDGEGRSALYLASANGHVEVVTLLLAAQANRNKTDNHGISPLHLAAAEGNTELVRVLCPGAQLDQRRREDQYTPLCIAARMGHTLVFAFLLRYHADATVGDRDGMAPIHIAARYGREEIMDIILADKLDTDLVDHNGQTALHIASRYGRSEMGENLVKANVDLTVRDVPDNWTSLEVAIRWGREDMAIHMLDHGAPFNIVGAYFYRCPLNIAVFYGREDIARELVERGADVNVCNENHESTLYTAASRRRRIARSLVEHGAEIPPQEQRLFANLLLAIGISADQPLRVATGGADRFVETLFSSESWHRPRHAQPV